MPGKHLFLLVMQTNLVEQMSPRRFKLRFYLMIGLRPGYFRVSSMNRDTRVSLRPPIFSIC